nr:hypothetical protein [Halomonas venusta]
MRGIRQVVIVGVSTNNSVEATRVRQIISGSKYMSWRTAHSPSQKRIIQVSCGLQARFMLCLSPTWMESMRLFLVLHRRWIYSNNANYRDGY